MGAVGSSTALVRWLCWTLVVLAIVTAIMSLGITFALLAVALRIVATLVFIEAVDPFQISDLAIAVAAGILVPVWAFLLARGVGREPAVMEPTAA